MGIVVCIGMLFGLSVLQPTPWNSGKRAQHSPEFVAFTGVAMLGLGFWNVIYACLNISGFWFWASLISGIAMVLGSFFVVSEEQRGPKESNLRRAVVVVLAISFLLYAVTIIQLNLGYPILR